MTEKRLYLKAGEGRSVRREADGKPWPDDGDFAELSEFVRRRLKDGDLVEAQPPRASKPSVDEKK